MRKILIIVSLCFVNNVFCQQLTFNNILNYCDEIDMKHKEIILKQIIHETGYLKYKQAKNKNNLLGLKRNNRLIRFKHWKDCLDFYKLKFQNNISESCYYSHLKKKRYARDRRYISKLKKININKIINEYRRDSTKRREEQFFVCKEYKW